MSGYNLTVDEDGRWCLAAEDDQVFRVMVEYSKSGRARCRKCSELIPAKALRIGKPVKWRGFISSWTHLECFWITEEEGGELITKEEIHGFDKVTKGDQKKVLENVARTKPPESLKMITPDDPGFIQKRELKRVKTPANLQLELLPFQQEGYGWMLSQEKSSYGGGILADEMGMGKTIQTVALIANDKFSKKKRGGPTLVVCPASAMLQWQEEIKRFTIKDALKVLVFHGQIRSSITPADILEHDVVLTTYPTLESAYRVAVNLTKVPCKYCGKKFIKRKLLAHNKFFCGPNSMRSARLAKTERSQKVATEKAMRTLKITKEIDETSSSSSFSKSKNRRHNIPTPANIYRELMEDAKRTPVSMYATKKQAGELQRNNSSRSEAKAEVSETDSVDDKTLINATLRSLWVIGEGEVCFWKIPKSKNKWLSNLFKDTDFKETYVFDEIETSDMENVILKYNDKKQTKFLLRLESDQAMFSVDDGKIWNVWNLTGESVSSGGRWVYSGFVDGNESSGEGFVADVSNIGHVVIRTFDQGFFLGVVVRYAPGKDPLWKVVHWDGDVEDLNRAELKKATNVNEMKAFARSHGSNDGNNLGRKRVKSSSNEDVRLSLLKAVTRAGITSSPSVPLTSDKAKRPARKCTSSTKKKKKVSFKSDSDFTEGDVSESSSDDDDSDFVSFDVAPNRKKANQSKKPKSNKNSAVKKGQESQAMTVLDEDEQVPEPKFIPATWGREHELFQNLKLRKSGVPLKNRKRKRQKKKTKTSAKAKGKSVKGKATKKSCSPSVRKTNGARKSPRKSTSTGKKKKMDDDFSSSDSDEDCSDSSSSYGDISTHLLESLKGPFYYAPKGDVVDDDGIDLGTSLLHCIAWKRVVLDEAHKIKDRVNSTAKSTYSLRGDPKIKGAGTGSGGGLCHRWCLTGTPMQNRVGELYSLVRFLRIDPYAFYYCSVGDCNCRSLHWSFGSMSRHCLQCGHPPMRHFSYFNKNIMNPIKRIGYTGDGRKAMLLLRDDLLGNMMLRRTKEEKQEDIRLPPLSVEVVKLQMSEQEKDFYESVYKNTRSKFDTYVKKGTLLHNYAHIFELLSRLRRSADHPYMVIHSNTNVDSLKKSFSFPSRSTGASDVCGICQYDIESMKECAVSNCRHTFHKSCITDFIHEKKEEANDDENDAQEGMGNSKNKKVKRKQGKTTEVVPDCPVCFQPLSVTMELHGGLGSDDGVKLESGMSANVENNEDESSLCVICFDNKRDALFMPCGHLYTCMHCYKSLNHRTCPMCRKDIHKVIRAANSSDNTSLEGENGSSSEGVEINNKLNRSVALIGRQSILQRIKLENFASSSKIDGVVAEVQKMIKLPLKQGEAPHKAIIFSQYTDMIDLVDWKLRTSGIKAVRLVGSMPVKERQSVLAAFRDPNVQPPIPVILMSLKAGGEGLNLQEATHVMILETWWNPQVHNQAYQRAHRIGQKRPVFAKLFVTQDTIEQRMHELQEKKQLIFDGAIDGSAKALQQLTEEDLRFLFAR